MRDRHFQHRLPQATHSGQSRTACAVRWGVFLFDKVLGLLVLMRALWLTCRQPPDRGAEPCFSYLAVGLA